jgi:hypothetical protein
MVGVDDAVAAGYGMRPATSAHFRPLIPDSVHTTNSVSHEVGILSDTAMHSDARSGRVGAARHPPGLISYSA